MSDPHPPASDATYPDVGSASTPPACNGLLWWLSIVNLSVFALILIEVTGPDSGMMIAASIWILVLALFYLYKDCVYLYRSWAFLLPGSRRTTPGKAVFLCFVPVFRMYWHFVAIRGLSEDTQSELQRLGRPAVANPALATIVCVLNIVESITMWAPTVESITVVNGVASGAHTLLYGLWIANQTRAQHALWGAEEDPVRRSTEFFFLLSSGLVLFFSVFTGLSRMAPV